MRKSNVKRLRTAEKRADMRFKGVNFILNFMRRAVPELYAEQAYQNLLHVKLDAETKVTSPTRKQRKKHLDALVAEMLQNQKPSEEISADKA